MTFQEAYPTTSAWTRADDTLPVDQRVANLHSPLPTLLWGVCVCVCVEERHVGLESLHEHKLYVSVFMLYKKFSVLI